MCTPYTKVRPIYSTIAAHFVSLQSDPTLKRSLVSSLFKNTMKPTAKPRCTFVPSFRWDGHGRRARQTKLQLDEQTSKTQEEHAARDKADIKSKREADDEQMKQRSKLGNDCDEAMTRAGQRADTPVAYGEPGFDTHKISPRQHAVTGH